MKVSSPRTKSFYYGVLSLCALEWLSLSANATLILEETFFVNVPGGYIATGYNGESRPMANPVANLSLGFSGPWSSPNSSNAQSMVASTTQLGFGSLPNEGTGSLNIWNAGNYSRATRRGLEAFPETETLWFATLINVNDVVYDNYLNNVASLLFVSGGLPGYSENGHAAVWGNDNGGNLAGFGWGYYAGNISIRYQTDADGLGFVTESTILAHDDYQPNTTYLLLAKLMINANGVDDNMQVWALNSLPANESALGEPKLNINANIVTSQADFVNMYANYGGGGARNENTATYFDAIRIGTAYSDVIPIPEPLSMALLGLAGTMFFCIRHTRTRRV